MSKPVTHTGQRFGRWIVIQPSQWDGRVSLTLVWCECGTQRKVRTCSLTRGASQSCGCLEKELAQARETTHGMRHTRLYRIWGLMKQRCSNPKMDNWEYYGGKGIVVCKAWQTFENFQRWSVENGYTDELTIDRIKSDRNYTPSNCRWVTWEVQQKNRPKRYKRRKA